MRHRLINLAIDKKINYCNNIKGRSSDNLLRPFWGTITTRASSQMSRNLFDLGFNQNLCQQSKQLQGTEITEFTIIEIILPELAPRRLNYKVTAICHAEEFRLHSTKNTSVVDETANM